MTLGLKDGLIEVRRSTPSGKYVARQFAPTAEGGKSCAKHIVRILRTQSQVLAFSSDADFPEENGFAKSFDLASFLKPFLKEAAP